MARRIIGKHRAEQLRKVNKNVLNKKSRVRLKYGAEVEGFETKSARDFKSIKEFNQYVRDMQDFTDRQGDYLVETKKGVKFTRQEIQAEERETKRINRMKAKKFNEIKEQAFRDRGRPTHLTVAEQKGLMGDLRYSDFRPLEFNLNRYETRADYARRMERIKDTYGGDFFRRFGENYQKNYIKALDNILGMSGHHLQDAVEKIDPMEFLELYHTENLADIDFIYEKQAIQTKVSVLEDLFKDRGYL